MDYFGCCVGKFEGTGLQLGGQLGGLCSGPAKGAGCLQIITAASGRSGNMWEMFRSDM